MDDCVRTKLAENENTVRDKKSGDEFHWKENMTILWGNDKMRNVLNWHELS